MRVPQSFVYQLFDQQNRHALLAQLRSHVQDAVYHQRRQAAGGLIQHQQHRFGDHALRHRQYLLLAAGQARGHLLFAISQFGEHGVDSVQFAAVASRRIRVRANQQVVLHRQMVKHAVAFQHLHQTLAHDVARRGLADVLAFEMHPPGLLGYEA